MIHGLRGGVPFIIGGTGLMKSSVMQKGTKQQNTASLGNVAHARRGFSETSGMRGKTAGNPRSKHIIAIPTHSDSRWRSPPTPWWA